MNLKINERVFWEQTSFWLTPGEDNTSVTKHFGKNKFGKFYFVTLNCGQVFQKFGQKGFWPK